MLSMARIFTKTRRRPNSKIVSRLRPYCTKPSMQKKT